MAAVTAMCTSFKVELAKALHNFSQSGGDVFKLVLIKPGMAGSYNAGSVNYSDITANNDEVVGTGYVAGGIGLTNSDPVSIGTTALWDFLDLSLASATISAAAAMICNSTKGNRAVSVHDFGGTVTSTNGTFQIIFPTPDAANAILRLA